MSMQLRIAHTTGFEYDGKANTSFNEARLTPLTLPGQIVAHSRVEVSPTPWVYRSPPSRSSTRTSPSP